MATSKGEASGRAGTASSEGARPASPPAASLAVAAGAVAGDGPTSAAGVPTPLLPQSAATGGRRSPVSSLENSSS
eukprot:617704-Lingulodinium_polyedra.AAC.1